MIETKELIKSFKNGEQVTTILKGIDLQIKKGEFVAIMGRSGAGKSTLMYQVSLLDKPTSGEIFIDGQNVNRLTTDEQTKFRLKKLGYVFQDYALLPDLTAKENVAVPLIMQGMSTEKAYKISIEALERVGLAHRTDSIPARLSGGEQQRVSVARAIAHAPTILFADEPTANLDSESSARVMEIFKELHKQGQTLVMVTHEAEYGRLADRIIQLQDGQITKEKEIVRD
ncbi:MAG: hypothetical protein RL094_638 [Candidatus Parcubacteria bacterium]